MSTQVVTPELRDWIVAQAAAGHSPEVVVEAMKASGWEEPTARIALATTLGEKVAGLPAAAPARPMPGREISVAPAAFPPATARSPCCRDEPSARGRFGDLLSDENAPS
jgi:prolyl 4-hydroxylase